MYMPQLRLLSGKNSKSQKEEIRQIPPSSTWSRKGPQAPALINTHRGLIYAPITKIVDSSWKVGILSLIHI